MARVGQSNRKVLDRKISFETFNQLLYSTGRVDFKHIYHLHFRKYLSKNALRSVIDNCPNLKRISLSKYSSKRLSLEMKRELSSKGIKVFVSEYTGRPIKFALVADLLNGSICGYKELENGSERI